LGADGNMYLSRIQKVCNQMKQLINNILEFSKITVKKELFTEVDLNNLIPDILQELNETIQEKNIHIVLEKLPVYCVNAVLMHQLFLNLIGNAVKYTSKTHPSVIRIYSEEFSVNKVIGDSMREVRYGRVFIEDNGIGFDQKYADEIFDMFRRLHPVAEYEGTGIGLALCKKIIEKHNGFISVKSEIDKGSTFIISIPLEHFES
ncbi:MAG TPA: ATP-binding protein, partial [Puia sp.]|nr:ATP-binding protein [Puia sp.]